MLYLCVVKQINCIEKTNKKNHILKIFFMKVGVFKNIMKICVAKHFFNQKVKVFIVSWELCWIFIL